jgi:Bardet-Biedl syndrome 9 protein
VLSEHTFFILDLSGHILVQRRLDHHPSCFWPYPASTDTAGSSSNRGSASTSSGGRAPAAVQVENLLIATHSKALQVYRGQQLAWAAQLDVLPVAVRVTNLGGVKGIIVALDDEGVLLWHGF